MEEGSWGGKWAGYSLEGAEFAWGLREGVEGSGVGGGVVCGGSA